MGWIKPGVRPLLGLTAPGGSSLAYLSHSQRRQKTDKDSELVKFIWGRTRRWGRCRRCRRWAWWCEKEALGVCTRCRAPGTGGLENELNRLEGGAGGREEWRERTKGSGSGAGTKGADGEIGDSSSSNLECRGGGRGRARLGPAEAPDGRRGREAV